jgi:hypothetical protein
LRRLPFASTTKGAFPLPKSVHLASDPRWKGLRESEHTAFYRVPYSAPGSKGGWLKIYATSPADALERAAAWHALSKATEGLAYGEPERVGPEAGPSYYTRNAA